MLESALGRWAEAVVAAKSVRALADALTTDDAAEAGLPSAEEQKKLEMPAANCDGGAARTTAVTEPSRPRADAVDDDLIPAVVESVPCLPKVRRALKVQLSDASTMPSENGESYESVTSSDKKTVEEAVFAPADGEDTRSEDYASPARENIAMKTSEPTQRTRDIWADEDAEGGGDLSLADVIRVMVSQGADDTALREALAIGLR